MILNEDHESVTDVMDIAVCISALSTPDLLNIGKIQRQFNINVNGPTQVKLYIRFLSNLFFLFKFYNWVCCINQCNIA